MNGYAAAATALLALSGVSSFGKIKRWIHVFPYTGGVFNGIYIHPCVWWTIVNKKCDNDNAIHRWCTSQSPVKWHWIDQQLERESRIEMCQLLMCQTKAEHKSSSVKEKVRADRFIWIWRLALWGTCARLIQPFYRERLMSALIYCSVILVCLAFTLGVFFDVN